VLTNFLLYGISTRGGVAHNKSSHQNELEGGSSYRQGGTASTPGRKRGGRLAQRSPSNKPVSTDEAPRHNRWQAARASARRVREHSARQQAVWRNVSNAQDNDGWCVRLARIASAALGLGATRRRGLKVGRRVAGGGGGLLDGLLGDLADTQTKIGTTKATNQEGTI
jgi:hypothetical protein